MVYLLKTKKEFTDFINKNELDQACFQHDMAYRKSKDLARRTQSDIVLRDKAFKIGSDPKYGYQRGLASMVYKFFDKKNLVEVVLSMNQIISSEMRFKNQLLENLRKGLFII